MKIKEIMFGSLYCQMITKDKLAVLKRDSRWIHVLIPTHSVLPV